MKRSPTLLLLCLLVVSHLYAAKWAEIDPADFTRTHSEIDPEADLELIFDDTTVAQYFIDWRLHTRYDFHMLVKVYNEEGVEQMTKFEVPLDEDQWISEISVRTVKPDGRVIEMDRDAVYDIEVERSSEAKKKAKAFAAPGVEPGDLVEMIVEVKSRGWEWSYVESFDSPYPSRRTTLRIKPAEPTIDVKFAPTIKWLNFPEASDKSKGGYYEFERLNENAYPEEDYAISDFHTRPTIILYYIFEKPPRNDEYWKEMGKRELRDFTKAVKGGRKVSDKVEKLTKGLKSKEEKLRTVYQFCATEIRNRSYPLGRISDSEEETMKENDTAGATLDRGYGHPHEINELFAAMATELGYSVSVAMVANRSNYIFDENLKFPFILRDQVIVVEEGKDRRYFQPGNPFLPFGFVNWWNADSKALLADSRKENFIAIPPVPASESVMTRSGELRIDESGTLSGRVTQTYEGYEAVEMRIDIGKLEGETAEEMIRRRIKNRLPRAEVDDIQISDTRENSLSFEVSYDLELPEFAEIVGDRIVFAPSIFGKGYNPPFQEEAEGRETGVLFSYPWTEVDNYTILLPEGYEVESGRAPEAFAIDQILSFDGSVKLVKGKPELRYERRFVMERSLFPGKAAELFRKVFANMKVQDAYAVTFKKSDSDS